MEYVHLVVRRGKTARCDGKTYKEGQTFSTAPQKARVLVKIGRAQIDHAADSATAVDSLPRPTTTDLREVLQEQRQVAEDSAVAPRRRNYRRRDMTAGAGN